MTDEPIRPPTSGLTPEAAEALERQGVVIESADISSEDVEADYDGGISDPFPTLGALSDEVPEFPPDLSSGDDIPDVGDESGEATDSRPVASPRKRVSRLKTPTEDKKPPRDATSRPPSLDEWTTFFSKIVLRLTCDWYLSYVFKDIDEDLLSEREVERLGLSDDEKKTIAVPFAELSNKSKFMRKHGRTIVSSGDAFNAMVVLGAWMARVNRIAAKYKPRTAKVTLNGSADVGSGQGTQEANGNAFQGSQGGHFPPGWNGGVVRGSG